MNRGDFVLCFFPFRGEEGPGSSPHIVLVSGVMRVGSDRAAIVYYTTTQVEYQGQRRPRQFLYIDEMRAESLGQSKAFHVDASRIAKLPLSPAYFPQMQQGIASIRGQDASLIKNVEKRTQDLLASGWEIDLTDRVASPAPGRK